MNTKNILNLNNEGWKTGKYPLFLGEELGLHDTMNRPYPKIFEMYKKLKSLDWAEDEISLEQDRMDFASCDKSTYDVMIKTLSWQFEADSVASRSIIALFAPFITNSDLNQLMLKWSENEALHATTYSEIARQCLNDPYELMEDIITNKDITARSGKIVEAFHNLKQLGAMYTLDKESVNIEECRQTILKALISLYCLEKIEFMGSFACTFAQAERELFLGVAADVQKIMIDETIHTVIDVLLIKEILLKDPVWFNSYQAIKEDIQDIVDSVYKQEKSWNIYIFSEGRSIVGLNTALLDNWLDYNAQEVYTTLGLKREFATVLVNPLSWMDKWLDIDSQQVAAQETDLNNYRLNSIIDDNKPVAFDFGIDRGYSRKVYTVYTKPECPYCIKLKEFMRTNNITFKEVNILEAKSAVLNLKLKGLTTVPQVFDESNNYKGDCTSFIATYSK